MTCFNRFWCRHPIKICSIQWKSAVFETVDFEFFGNGKIHNVDSATNGSPTRPVDLKTTTQPVCLTSGHVGKSSCVLWCGPRLFVSIFMCFLWFLSDLLLTCAWLVTDFTITSNLHQNTHKLTWMHTHYMSTHIVTH